MPHLVVSYRCKIRSLKFRVSCGQHLFSISFGILAGGPLERRRVPGHSVRVPCTRRGSRHRKPKQCGGWSDRAETGSDHSPTGSRRNQPMNKLPRIPSIVSEAGRFQESPGWGTARSPLGSVLSTKTSRKIMGNVAFAREGA